MKRAAVFITTFLFAFGLLFGFGQVNVFAEPNPEYDINIHDTFPDEVFREYISENFDKPIDGEGPDGWLQPHEIRKVSEIDVSSYKLDGGAMVQSLAGIEKFTELTSLTFGNSVTAVGEPGVGLSQNTLLQSLHCDHASYEAIDNLQGSELPKLMYFSAEYADSAALDLSGAPKLEYIIANNSNLTGIAANDCTSLVKIEANDCSKLEYIVAKNTTVKNVTAENSAIVSADFEGCPNLKTINMLEGNNAIRQLNLKGCSSLDWLWIKCLGLSYLNLAEIPSLSELRLQGDVSTLDVSANTKLSFLHAPGVNLDYVTLGSHPDLRTMELKNNNLQALDISGCPALKFLTLDGNKLTELDVSACPLLDSAVKATGEGYAPGYYTDSDGNTLEVDEFVKIIYSGGTISGSPIKATPDITLSATSYVYDGKVKKPAVKVEANGNVLDSSEYSVSYASGRKKVGTYKVTVKLKNHYSGSSSATFKIIPKGTTLSKLTPAKKALTVKWKKQSAKMSTARITGYQIQYSTSKDFSSGNKLKTVKGYSKTSLKISKLKSGKTYYVRIRTYMKTGGKTYYSKWSKALSKKAK